jgi:hypothetical protein
MSDRTKFIILLSVLILSLALAYLINSSYSHILITHA